MCRSPTRAKSNLFWSPDSKKLAFTGNVDGKPGTYTIESRQPDAEAAVDDRPASQARWLKRNQIVWLSAACRQHLGDTAALAATTPTATTPTRQRRAARFGGRGDGGAAPAGGRLSLHRLPGRRSGEEVPAAFDMCWRTMRDNWYDDKLGNRDWNAVRAKYRRWRRRAGSRDAARRSCS